MIRKRNGEIEWLEFDSLQGLPLKHGVFLRKGGVSKGDFNSFNLSFNVGDHPESVNSNISRVQDILKVPKIIWGKQTHGDQITLIDLNPPSVIPECDSMMTSTPEVGLMITHADCQAAIMYDPIQHAVGIVHSGWRGSVQNIYFEAIRNMKIKYGSKPENLLVCISPSLGPLKAEFVNYRKELPESFWGFQVKPDYFNFWAISEDQLKHCGVLPEHIEIAGICTYQNPDEYFSYRRQKVTGRHGTVVALAKK